jgi:hypothetical protein
MVRIYIVDWSGSRVMLVPDSYERGHETSDSVENGNFLTTSASVTFPKALSLSVQAEGHKTQSGP